MLHIYISTIIFLFFASYGFSKKVDDLPLLRTRLEEQGRGMMR